MYAQHFDYLQGEIGNFPPRILERRKEIVSTRLKHVIILIRKFKLKHVKRSSDHSYKEYFNFI